jgi:hypothetical protein
MLWRFKKTGETDGMTVDRSYSSLRPVAVEECHHVVPVDLRCCYILRFTLVRAFREFFKKEFQTKKDIHVKLVLVILKGEFRNIISSSKNFSVP